MDSKKLNIKEILISSWSIMVEKFFFFLTLLCVILAFDLSSEYVLKIIKNDRFFYLILSFIFYLVDTLFILGFIKIVLAMVDNKKTEINDFFSCHTKVIKQLIATIFYSLMCLFVPFIFALWVADRVGLENTSSPVLLAIVSISTLIVSIPFIFLGIKFQFFAYFIVDKNSGPIESLKESSRITKGSFLKLLGFNLFILTINIIGAFLFGVGLFFTLPVSALAMAKIYRILTITDIKNKKTKKRSNKK